MKLYALLSFIAMTASQAYGFPQYRMDFVEFSSTHTSRILGLNNLGDVVGTALSGSSPHSQPYVKLAGSAPMLLSHHFMGSEAASINDHREIVGHGFGNPSGFDPGTGIVWHSSGGYDLLSRFTGYVAEAYLPLAMSNAGIIVGKTEPDPGADLGAACAWNRSGHDGWLPGTHTDGFAAASDVNEAGTIVGCTDFGDGRQVPSRWLLGGGIEHLPMGSKTRAYVTSINESGMMVGLGSTESLSNGRSLLVWSQSGGLLYEIPLPGASLGASRPHTSYDARINDSGDVVVSSLSQEGVQGAVSSMWLWNASTGLTPVWNLVAGVSTGSYFDSVSGFNNSGQIVCTYSIPNGIGRTNFQNVLLTPVPEPGTLAVLALGAVGLLKKRRK